MSVIILSQRPLVRELLGELLRLRCGARIVASLASFDAPKAPLPAAGILVCDLHGLDAGAFDSFRKRLQATNPRIRIVRIDDSQADFDIEKVLNPVRGLFAAAPVVHERLTPLELDVMLAVAAGHRNAEIARRMRRSSKTIEKHRANLQRKLGVRTVAQLTAYAIHHGLLHADAILAPRRQT